MTGQLQVEPVPRITLRVAEAAASLGMSGDHFHEHVSHQLRWVRIGRVKVVPVAELREWAKRNSERIGVER